MKTIGLLGGMSWESTAGYYRAINQGVNSVLGGLHSAQIVLHSVDFDPIEKLQQQEDWPGAAAELIKGAQGLERAGADFLLICTNTMHKVAPEIEAAIEIPLLHIADATGEALKQQGIERVGLLGTSFTMEQDFYKSRLQQRYGLDVVVPEAQDRKIVHDIIYNELCLGLVNSGSRSEYVRIIADMARAGAQAVILGCTEIGMLVQQSDCEVLLFDTTAIHAEAAVVMATAHQTPGCWN